MRSILVPILLICALGAPIYFSEPRLATPDPTSVDFQPTVDNPFLAAPSSQDSRHVSPFQNLNRNANSPADLPVMIPSRNLATQIPQSPTGDLFQLAGYQRSTQPLPTSTRPTNPSTNVIRSVPFGLASSPIDISSQPQPIQTPFPVSQYADSFGYQQIGSYPSNGEFDSLDRVGSPNPLLPGMTPDYGAVETLVFPGNEFGPDLTAQPMPFLPVTDLNEIFRFDITQDWVKRRWNRVSTTPNDVGLHGLRIALVTGTNSWDLHGSLTYLFDAQQQLQRITFRGWTGDASRFLQVMESQFKFEPQPSHLAGFYIASNRRSLLGGILMKDPIVVSSANPIERLAIVMEINNSAGAFELSTEFRELIAGSVQ